MQKRSNIIEKNKITILTIVSGILFGLFLFKLNIELIWGLLSIFIIAIILISLKNINLKELNKLLLLALLFSAFFGPVLLLINVGPFHLFLFRIILIIFIPLSIFYFLKNKQYKNYKKINVFILFYIILLLYAVILSFFSLDYAASLKYITFLIIGLLIISYSYFLLELQDLKRLLMMIVLVFIILISIGIWENMTYNHLEHSTLYSKPNPNNSPTGSFHNQNDYATFLALYSPFMLISFLFIPNKYLKVMFLSLFLISFYLIIETHSRANILASILQLVFFPLLFLNKKMDIKKIFKYSLIFLVVVLCGLLLFNFYNFKSIEKIGKDLNFIQIGFDGKDESINTRIFLTKSGLEFLSHSFFFGIGPGQITSYMEYYKNGPALIHNWWMEIAVQFGILIFIFYVYIYIKLIIKTYKGFLISKDNYAKIFNASLFLSLIGFSIASISSSSLITKKFVWIIFALAIIMIHFNEVKNESISIKPHVSEQG